MASIRNSKSILAVLLLFLLTACVQPAMPQAETAPPAQAATEAATDLAGIKAYLLEKATALRESTATLRALGDEYYTLAEQASFDYEAFWANDPEGIQKLVFDARATWMVASPLYEQMEGIVAGTPSLAEFDVILDAGGELEDPENAAPYVTLPDGTVLRRPGNLFGVLESTLWGTFPEFTVPDLQPDYDGNGTVDFGEILPHGGVLKSAADTMDSYANELFVAAEAWTPTESDAFTALVVMVPTMSEYFGSWRDSRFVTGEESTQADFVAISRLADIQDILGGLEIVYSELQPLVATVDDVQSTQIATDLGELKTFVTDVYAQENDGKRFTPEEADLLGIEAQNRATAITGQISQVAAQLNITVQE